MKIANVIIQSLVLLGTIISVIFLSIDNYSSYHRNLWNNDSLLLILFIQFFFGLYQLLNALIITIRLMIKKQLNILFKFYWLSVLGYFVVGAVLAFAIEQFDIATYSSDKERFYVLWLLSAWSIALYYFVVCIIHMQNKLPEKKEQ